MGDPSPDGARSLFFGCFAMIILIAVVAGVLAVVFLWDVNVV